MSFANIPGLKTYTLPKNLSEEEKQNFLHESTIDSEKKKREEEIVNASKTPEQVRIKYDYNTILNMKDEDIPSFIKSFFKHPAIETSQKDIFIESFCPKYINNIKYRSAYEGKYIFIEDGIIKGIIDSESELDLSTLTHKLLIKIGKQDQNYGFYKRCYDLPINTFYHDVDGEKIQINRPMSFQVKCYFNDTKEFDNYITNTKIIDSGCSVTPLPDDKIWNYNTARFIDQGIENKLLAFTKLEDIITCNGTKTEQFVYLKSPIYVSLDGLKFVELKVFSVSLDQNSKNMPLIGMDIISQYTMIFSNFDGKFQLRICNQRRGNLK
jgi:hypothetical protein